MRLVFIHGWGFDAGFWDKLAPLLPHFPQQRVEFGFFDAALDAKPDIGDILIGHSLGFVHGLRMRQDWAAWVAINSFPRFVATASQPGCVPTAALHKMKKQLSHDPQRVLKNFYSLIGLETPNACATPNVERLRSGLDELRDTDISEKLLQNVPGLVLAARNDPLVPTVVSEHMGSDHANISWHETGGHLLPYFAPQWCAERIAGFLEAMS